MFKLINSCRLCRSYENINTTLHRIDSDNLSFFQKLNRIAPGTLENNTNLPDGICMNCITELNIAYKFINKCSESQAIFQRYLEQLRNGQQIQPANNREVLIKVIKLEETYCDNSEVQLNNSITVKDEKESGFLNEEINGQYYVNDYASGNSESDQANFQNYIKVEEEIRNVHANHKNENIEENCNDSPDDIQTNQRGGNEVKLENNYSLGSFEELKHVYDKDASEFTTTRDHSDSINMNNEYEFVDVKNIEIDEDDFENDILDLPKNSGHFTGFDLVECDVANGNKVKYDLKLELELAKVINHKHMIKNVVDKVVERSEIGENSSIVNINNIQAPNKYKICEKACTAKNDINVPMYQCTICGRATLYISGLKQHMRIHTNEKPFICKTCNRAFTQSSSLKHYCRIHTSEKPFKCETCNKAYNDSSNLKKHIRIHTNEKPFKCEMCTKAFNDPSGLKYHIRTHTNEKPFKCETCNATFIQSSALKQHIRRKHTNEKQ